MGNIFTRNLAYRPNTLAVIVEDLGGRFGLDLGEVVCIPGGYVQREEKDSVGQD